MSILRHLFLLGLALMLSGSVLAQANLEANTPAIKQLKSAMHGRFDQLAPLLASGAIGLANDGTVQLRNAGAVALAQRQATNTLIAAENADRAALYREIARANGHPEWEQEIRATFAQRWVDKAAPRWWVQARDGRWLQK